MQLEVLRDAFNAFKELAVKGYGPACEYLGATYEQNGMWKEAVKVWMRGVKSKHPPCCHNLARAFEHGVGVHKVDLAKASTLYRKAASGSYGPALLRLARAHLRFNPVDLALTQSQPSKIPRSPTNSHTRRTQEDLKRALQYLHRAVALNNHAESAVLLAALYDPLTHPLFSPGPLPPPDPEYAATNLLIAARNGSPEACARLGSACERGELGMTPDVIEAVTWYERAISAAGVDEGEFTDAGASPKDAVRPLDPAASAAAFAISRLLMNDARFSAPALANVRRAHFLALRAAQAGYAPAELAVAWFLERGAGCAADLGSARLWVLRAAKHGDRSAMDFVSEWMENRDEVMVNDTGGDKRVMNDCIGVNVACGGAEMHMSTVRDTLSSLQSSGIDISNREDSNVSGVFRSLMIKMKEAMKTVVG
ncbi:hypothetical protein HDU93_003655 [Gonapodya sp. JEL0774]|nr:hypothetical protein HDU93_003655 [Gonapodya sp. JEL0774]